MTPICTQIVVLQMSQLRTLSVILLCFVIKVCSGREGCFRRDGPVCKAATKTPYRCVAPEGGRWKLPDREELPVGCEAKKVWLLARHGTRYPSEKGILHMTRRLPEIASGLRKSGPLCDHVIDDIRAWDHGLVGVEQDKMLHPEGEAEMMGIAERFQARFPDFFRSKNGSEFRFRSTSTERAVRSRFFFAAGLFGRDVVAKSASSMFKPTIRPHDPILRFYKLCSRWLSEVKKNKAALIEVSKFQESEVFQTMREVVTARIGLTELISLDDLEAVYVGCVFGQAWNPDKTSPWCNVFADEELSIMEYREDLEAYWQDGYGHEINYEQACVMFGDVVRSLEEDESGISGVFSFSHSGAVLKFSSFLGLFRDGEEPLRHDGFLGSSNRSYRTTHNDAFATNVAFVKADCEGGSGSKVGLFFNERLIPIPGCPDEGDPWCDYEVFKEAFRDRAEECDFDAICDASAAISEEPVDDEDKF